MNEPTSEHRAPMSAERFDRARELRNERQRWEAEASDARRKITAGAFNAFVYQLSDILIQNIQGRQDPTWRHHRYVSDGTRDRTLIEHRIRARRVELITITDDQIAALDAREVDHLINDLGAFP